MLIDIQSKFTLTIADFIQKVYQNNYKLTFGEAWRPPEMARIYAQEGKGIINSVHCLRLAVDLNAFYNGEYLDGSKDSHIPLLTKLGEIWESMGGSWGGRFHIKDYNHYSFEYNGVE